MKHRILVIDDEPSVRESFRLAFDESEFLVDTAESGQKGLAALVAEQYDLIFLDLNMPGMNGVDTLRNIRKMDQEIPVYIITAFARVFFEDLEKLKREKFDFEIMKKPLGQDEIVAVTRGVLRGGIDIKRRKSVP